MATPFPIPVTAAQVGTYFVNQYCQVLQTQPDYVHQFYSDASTMVRIDGIIREAATGMLQIHQSIMSLSFAAIEIKTAQSLESWNGGVLVMVTGAAHIKNYNRRRKFAQTFFLAPQEKGYFVLNDIFQFTDDELNHHPAVILSQANVDAKLNVPNAIPQPVSNYMMGGEIQSRDFGAPIEVKENGPIDDYSFPDKRMQQVPDSETNLENDMVGDSNGSLQNTNNSVQEHQPASADESVAEPQKHTYASILRVAKGQPTPSATPQSSSKNIQSSEWDHAPDTSYQNTFEQSMTETAEELPGNEDDDEIKSVYVRNLLPTISVSEIEEEFKKFGRIRADGVVIRSRKDVGVCYAFVEFEDLSGVHNAVKAGSVQVAGRQLYIEERRPNSNIPSRSARRGRGSGSYQTEAPRGRFGSRSFGRGSGNGYYRPGPRHDRGYSGHQVSRDGQNSTVSSS